MGQPNEKPTVEQVLQLVKELTAEERALVVQEIGSFEELRRKIAIGMDQAKNGEIVDGDLALEQLIKRAEEKLDEPES
jgi:hypothetical protein